MMKPNPRHQDCATPAPAPAIRRGIETALSAAMQRLRRTAGPRAMIGAVCRELAALQRGGKRLRPMLFLMAYKGYRGRPHPAIWRGAAAIELLHTFALIHDDLVDRSARRHGGPSLTIRLARHFALDPEPGGAGADLAMLAGDVMFAFAVDAFLAMDLPAEQVLRALRLIVGAAVRTGSGAMEELIRRTRGDCLTPAELMALYDAKTGMYSFVCPLQAGAVLAGADAGELARLERFGRHVGRAYQIADDLADLDALLSGAAPPPADPAETILLFPMQTALRILPGPAGMELRRLCRRQPPAAAEVARLRELLARAGAAKAARRAANLALNRAWRELDRLHMAGADKSCLRHYCAAMLDLRV